jgi:acyl-coenzyme A thioesterase PaaI-like protein
MDLKKLWNRLSPLPGGKWIFSKALGKAIPYSGSISPLVLHLASGHVKVLLRDKPRVRNHLDSVHAVALMNLAELSTGLALVGSLPEYLRGILTGFRIEYLKKARGLLTAEARCTVPTEKEKKEHVVTVDILNESGDTVCRAYATWLVSPVPDQQ